MGLLQVALRYSLGRTRSEFCSLEIDQECGHE
jgi:hypothetical protein